MDDFRFESGALFQVIEEVSMLLKAVGGFCFSFSLSFELQDLLVCGVFSLIFSFEGGEGGAKREPLKWGGRPSERVPRASRKIMEGGFAFG